MSDLPCLQTELGGVKVFFSRLEDICELEVFRFTVNWRYLRVFAALGEPGTHETGLNEVSSALMGECLLVDDGCVTRRLYWHPRSIAAGNPLETREKAVTTLRATTLRCVGAWASRHPAVIHRLSGGLDSSIVATCLRLAHPAPKVTCLNLYSPGALGDERQYARAVASGTGFALVERELNPELNLRVFESIRLTSRPTRDFTAYENHQPEAALAGAHGATAVFCGELGDTVFGRSGEEYAASECLYRRGYRPAVLSAAREVGEYWRLSIWKVLGSAIRDARTSRTRRDWTRNLFGFLKQPQRIAASTLLRSEAFEDVVSDISRFTNPWFVAVQAVPVAKLWTIAALAAIGTSEPPFRVPRDPPVVIPLAAQPLVELALRIPAYFTLHRGKDRSVARDAFVQELPSVIVERTAKGSPGPWTRKVVSRNLQFLREFLLDGELVREEILDREQLESALATAPTKTGLLQIRLIRHLYLEGWLRAYRLRKLRTAA